MHRFISVFLFLSCSSQEKGSWFEFCLRVDFWSWGQASRERDVWFCVTDPPLCPVSQEIIVLSFFLSLSGCVCPKRFNTSLLKHPDLDSPGLIPEKNHKTVCPQPWTVILQRKFISASGKWCIFSHLRSIDVGAVASWLVHMLRRIELRCSCGHHEIKSTFSDSRIYI